MLYKNAVNANTLELLKQLQSKTYLEGFFLAGDTAIALKIGHRKSIDLDLFSNFDFDVEPMLENLSSDFDFKLYYSAKNTIKGSVKGVMTDILAHRYPLVAEPEKEKDIQLLSLPDIIAMKLNAIAVSGQRVKDFIDIFFLLDIYDFRRMIAFYKEKYKQYHVLNVLKSLVYFDDIDFSEWPEMITTPTLQWSTVKQKLEKEVAAYVKMKM